MPPDELPVSSGITGLENGVLVIGIACFPWWSRELCPNGIFSCPGTCELTSAFPNIKEGVITGIISGITGDDVGAGVKIGAGGGCWTCGVAGCGTIALSSSGVFAAEIWVLSTLTASTGGDWACFASSLISFGSPLIPWRALNSPDRISLTWEISFLASIDFSCSWSAVTEAFPSSFLANCGWSSLFSSLFIPIKSFITPTAISTAVLPSCFLAKVIVDVSSLTFLAKAIPSTGLETSSLAKSTKTFPSVSITGISPLFATLLTNCDTFCKDWIRVCICAARSRLSSIGNASIPSAETPCIKTWIAASLFSTSTSR